ncbi:MAG: hypothetical protein PHD37_02630 [Gallionellaceae bacterium]|nr:hypothetical protein [Gallionellaceae bacterium]
MNKRKSSPPRRPRDPVARAVRTPRFKQQVVPDKRWQERLKEKEDIPPAKTVVLPPLPKGD